MSRRRREIKKRKKEQERALQPAGSADIPPETPLDTPHDTSREMSPEPSGYEGEGGVTGSAGNVAETFSDGPGEPEFDDVMVAAPSPPAAPKAGGKAKREKPRQVEKKTENSWLGRNKENLLLGMLVLYVVLLGLGTVGELFEIEWILNLPLFR